VADVMRAWAVSTPGPVDSGPLVAIEREIPTPARVRFDFASWPVESVAPIFTSSRVTFRHGDLWSFPVTRSWAWSTRSDQMRVATPSVIE
jgi:hypothetical protein